MATPTTVQLSMDVSSVMPDNLGRIPGAPAGVSEGTGLKIVDSANASELSEPKDSEKNTPGDLGGHAGGDATSAGMVTDGSDVPYLGFNPYASLLNKAKLDIEGDLDAAVYDWTAEESSNRRRLVQFWRRHEHNHIICGFNPVTAAERVQNSIVVSCIYWDDKNDFFITSVDCIYLLEALIGVRFTVEEKNRIRRNLEGFRPLTVSKNKEDSATFFKLIMSFPNPKPRNIEKDVKVFPWRVLSFALKKIIGKYTASYSTTASIALDQCGLGGEDQAMVNGDGTAANGNSMYLQPVMTMAPADAPGSGAVPDRANSGTPDYLQQYRMSEQQRRFSTSVLNASNVSQWLQQQMASEAPGSAPSYLHQNPTALGDGTTINPLHLHHIHASGSTASHSNAAPYLGLPTAYPTHLGVTHPTYLTSSLNPYLASSGLPGSHGAAGAHAIRANDRPPAVGRRHSVADPYNAEHSLQHRRHTLAVLKALNAGEHNASSMGSVPATVADFQHQQQLLAMQRHQQQHQDLLSALQGGGTSQPPLVDSANPAKPGSGELGATDDHQFHTAQFEEAMKAALARSGFGLLGSEGVTDSAALAAAAVTTNATVDCIMDFATAPDSLSLGTECLNGVLGGTDAAAATALPPTHDFMTRPASPPHLSSGGGGVVETTMAGTGGSGDLSSGGISSAPVIHGKVSNPFLELVQQDTTGSTVTGPNGKTIDEMVCEMQATLLNGGAME
ncbi:hypothetical protein IWQ60_004964 [Tieghemiomyces parasiticus]|uniref:DUF7082 domain-containing protein n=1 Tax=Tieghemiomyces parasiticus TaxID=78921 RepID=A0A9W8AEY6_9FUNG|nr:hypothetical protein IWQ60_004964 [Tieghemiomyces parasiticus]